MILGWGSQDITGEFSSIHLSQEGFGLLKFQLDNKQTSTWNW